MRTFNPSVLGRAQRPTETSVPWWCALVRVMAVDGDGHMHITVLPGTLEKNRHLVGRALP